MTYPNAYEGVKKIRTAEIIGLLIGVVGIVLSIMITAAGSSGGSGGTIAGVTALALITGILAIVAFILKLLGLNRAAKDEPNFKTALVFALAGIVLSILSSAFSGNATVSGIFSTVSDILDVFIFIMVVRGIISLAKRLGNSAVAQKGNSLLKKLVAVYVIMIIISLIGNLLQKNPTAMTIAGILLLIAGILDLVIYISYLKYLGKAVAMLQK